MKLVLRPVVDRVRRRQGFTLIEIMIVVAIILILSSILIPFANQMIMLAHETAAIRTVTTIHTAQGQYRAQFGRLATSLQELGPPASGQEGPAAASLISHDLALGLKSGYKFTLQGTPNGYRISADPQTYNSSGRRTFYSDQTMVLRENWGQEPATDQSPEVK